MWQVNLEGIRINLGETWCICNGKDSEMLNTSCSGGENLELQPHLVHPCIFSEVFGIFIISTYANY